MSEQETLEVTIKVPKRLMRLLEAENYFGWKKEDFLVAAIIRSIDIEIHDLDYRKEEKLLEKYGENIGTLHIRIDPATKLRRVA